MGRFHRSGSAARDDQNLAAGQGAGQVHDLPITFIRAREAMAAHDPDDPAGGGEHFLAGAADEVIEGEIKQAPLPDGSNVALYRVDGAIYATADMCTHGEASLAAEGIITGKTVECTFHFGTFDVTTGEPTGMPCEIALKTYPVTIVDGNVQIEV